MRYFSNLNYIVMTLQSYNKERTFTKSYLTTALEYHAAGLKVLPVNNDKRPACPSWKEYQTNQTEEQVRQLFSRPCWGIAVLTGQGIEALDFDQKYWLHEKPLFQEYMRHNDVLNKNACPVTDLYIQSTINDGMHVVYRCAEIGGNAKLASRPPTAEEAEADDRVKVLIETRGEGGYIVVAPSPGYEDQDRGSLTALKEITPQQRAGLFAAAKHFDSQAEEEAPPAEAMPDQSGLTPWDDYNQQHSALDLLTADGWTEVFKRGERVFLKRPGDSKAAYSGNYHTGKELFICWSSSTQFEPEKAHTAFGVYAVLNHSGDFSAAAKALYAEGYGDRHKPKQQKRDNRGRYRGYDQEPEEEVNYLEQLKEVQQRLKEAAAKPVQFAPEIISLGETPIFQKYTINSIQGREGSHKSRFSELMVSLLIKRNDVHHSHFLGFARNPTERCTVALVDTERNLMDELPFAIQAIKRKAGYEKEEHPAGFLYTSLKKIPRRDRLTALKQWLTDARNSTSEHLFVVLDVVTDCVSSFNNDAEAMELFDFIGLLCEEQDCTFLIVIHENPGGGEAKARGHVGTESANKASTALQIGFVKGNDNEPSDLIQLKFRKLRRGKRPAPLNLTYSAEQNGLIVAPAELVEQVMQDNKNAVHVDSVAKSLYWSLIDSEGKPIARKDICEDLMEEFEVSKNTILDRLRTIEKQVANGELGWLNVTKGARNAIMYQYIAEEEE